MAVTHLGATAPATSTTCVITISTPTPGAWLVVMAGSHQETYDLTITDNGSSPLSWTSLLYDTNHPTASMRVRVWAAYYTDEDLTTITIGHTANTIIAGSCLEITGLGSSSVTDGTGVITGRASSDDSPDGTYRYITASNVTASATGGIILTGAYCQTSRTLSWAGGDGYTGVSSGYNRLAWGYQAGTASTSYPGIVDLSGDSITTVWVQAFLPAATTPTLNARAGEVQVGYSDLAG